MADERAQCPCCADRLAFGALFKRPADAPSELCGACADALSPEEADALLDAMLSASPVKLRWDLSASQVAAGAAALERRCRARNDAVVRAHAAGTLSWQSTCAPLDEEDAEFALLESALTFPAHVSTDKALRDACTEAETQLSKYSVEANARADVYDALLAFSRTEEAGALRGERQRYLARRLRDFRRVGLHLDAETSARVRELNTRLSSLGIQFSKNLGEHAATLSFDGAALDGLPADWLAERRQEDGLYKVSLKYPCVVPVLERCRVEATRQRVEMAFNSRCREENTVILEELVRLRDEKARLLGYPTHAEFVTEIRMAGGAERVKGFLSELADKLRPLLEEELKDMRELKVADGAPDPTIYAWDRAYYCKRLEERRYQVDHEVLKQYFPLETVKEGLLAIYQNLLGLTFATEAPLEAAAWHKDVRAFRVTDTASGELVGFFYTDLHPRDGKYGHAACFGLQPACELRGAWMPPVAACVCNFPSPRDGGGAALLSHREVETFFHEFGHVMHQLCSKATMARFSGTRVERDFVEAPSQMLENWCWERESLCRMSCHHETAAPLPEELLAALLAAKKANAGVVNMRQIALASFDQAIHTAPEADTAQVFARLSQELLQVPASPGTNMAATFGHMAGGYDAQYYGYMWSDVYSADMFESRFLKEGILSPVTGMSYRKEILEPGGSRDAMDSLKAFLGREPIQEPFLRSKGLAL